MRFHGLILLPLTAALVQPAGAQARPDRAGAGERTAGAPARAASAPADPVRTVLGMTVSWSGDERDTLGLLVTSVKSGGPAARAGIRGGDRVAEINSANLRLPSSELGERDFGDLIARRFAREVGKLKANDSEEATLRIYADGQSRSVTVDLTEPEPAPTVASRGRRVPVTVQDEAEGGGGGARGASISSTAARRRAGLDGVLEAMRDLQSQVQQLGDDQRSGRLRDALADADRQLAELQRQLREARAEAGRGGRGEEESEGVRERAREVEREDRPEPTRPERARPETVRPETGRFEGSRGTRVASGRAERAESSRAGQDTTSDQWLRVMPVTSELVPYFGEESQRGLLVTDADSSWAPIRAGDVILRVNGTRVYSVERLKTAIDQRRDNTVEIVRRGRVITVTLAAKE
jgi:hypothetical protein